MKRAVLGLFLTLLLLPLIAAQPVPDKGSPEKIVIQASPHTILLTWNTKGGVRITIHAEIDYSIVDNMSVTLGGFEALSTFADSRGELVAKFDYAEVRSLVDDGNTELTLRGTLEDGTEFWGTDIVRVVE